MKHGIIRIPPEEAVRFWPQVRRMLKPAIDMSGGRWRPEYVLAGLATGRQQLWVITNGSGLLGAATTEVVFYPERKNLVIHFLGGERFDAWFPDLSEALTAHARELGCNAIECVARAGFWKWFKDDGFTRPSVFYEKKLEGS